MRIAIVTSHPIQYQAPWFRELARRADIEVFFCQQQHAADQAMAGYDSAFDWDVPLLEGYPHTWLTNVSRRPSVFTFSGCDCPDIGAHLSSGGFDVCIVNGWYLKAYLQAIVACRRLSIPVLLRGDSQRADLRPLWVRALKYPFYRALLNAVDGHLYVGAANRRYLRHYAVPESRLWFVPHSVDVERFAAAAERARQDGDVDALRKRLGLVDGEIVCLFVGRLIAEKRLQDFVNAIAAASRTRALTGLIVGSGPLQESLQAQTVAAGARILFAGFANQTLLPSFYAAAQMLVLPSESETWGLVANESLACGTPIIVSDRVGCASDLVTPATGRTFPRGDVAALAAAMLDLTGQLEREPETLAQSAHRIALQYGSSASAEATLHAVAEVVRLRAAARTPVSASS